MSPELTFLARFLKILITLCKQVKTLVMVGNRDREHEEETTRRPGGSGPEREKSEAAKTKTRSQGLPGSEGRELDEELRGQLRNKNEQVRRNMKNNDSRSEMMDTE